ncbi:hypothetical protein [Rhabdothermincola salaria]|uniref:hypothetical protein n=1 Tax=Rhabdothermincola salaria TaxID=2903142 RepID=UPI001E384D66|nr:hypothetical protein [Rhabdothermincola salaria]MCD9625034.1 hypothetical protein [Rhabdothermincola salaria]
MVGAGAAAQVGGLALDAWSHAADGRGPDGVLGTQDVGHLLFVAGLVAVGLGAVLALLGPRLYATTGDTGPGRRLAQFGAPAVAMALVVGGLVGAGSSSLAGAPASSSPDPNPDHDHDATTVAAEAPRCDLDVNPAAYYREAVMHGVDLNGGAIDHDHAGADPAAGIGEGEVAGADPGPTTAPAEDHDHDGPQAWTPITDPQVCEQLRTELAEASAVAARHPTAADARDAGYVMVTTYIPGIASHWMNFGLVDTTFDVGAPEMLLYDGNGDDAQLVGLSYYLIGSADTPPTAGFAGGNTDYHRHIGLCVRGSLVVGGEGTSSEECAARGGIKNDGSRAWMAHAWVVPGCESPWGVFSAKNPKLTDELGRNSGQGPPCSGSGTDYDDTPGVPAELAHVVLGADEP